MAFPSVVNAVATPGANNNSYALTIPSAPGPSGGQLLLAIVGGDSDATATMSGTGWTDLGYGSNGTQGNSVFAKEASGGGNDVGTVTGTSRPRFAHTYCIEGWSGVIADIEVAYGTTNSLDPPTLDPAGAADDYLWIAAIRNNNTITAAPTNYTNLITVTYLGAAHLGSARRLLNATSENPGAFTAGAASGAHALTIGVKPGTAGLRRLGAFLPLFA